MSKQLHLDISSLFVIEAFLKMEQFMLGTWALENAGFE